MEALGISTIQDLATLEGERQKNSEAAIQLYRVLSQKWQKKLMWKINFDKMLATALEIVTTRPKPSLASAISVLTEVDVVLAIKRGTDCASSSVWMRENLLTSDQDALATDTSFSSDALLCPLCKKSLKISIRANGHPNLCNFQNHLISVHKIGATTSENVQDSRSASAKASPAPKRSAETSLDSFLSKVPGVQSENTNDSPLSSSLPSQVGSEQHL